VSFFFGEGGLSRLSKNSHYVVATYCQMNCSKSASWLASGLFLYLRSYMARYMQVSKKARVGSFVPVATYSQNSSTSPLRSRHRKLGLPSDSPVRNWSSSEMRNTRSSSAWMQDH
jgi:hypothetical protein